MSVRVYRTEYRGPTNTKGARIVVADTWANTRTVIPFDHAASDAHLSAVGRVAGPECDELVIGGWHPRGSFIVAIRE